MARTICPPSRTGNGKQIENREVDVDEHAQGKRKLPSVVRLEDLVVEPHDSHRAAEVSGFDVRLWREQGADHSENAGGGVLHLGPGGGMIENDPAPVDSEIHRRIGVDLARGRHRQFDRNAFARRVPL